MKVIVVGRHKPADIGENIEVISRQDITFPHTSEMCEWTLGILIGEALIKKAALVFQAIPGQMAVAIARSRNIMSKHVRVGVIVSVPGERPANITRRFYFLSDTDLKEAWGVANHLNPNIKIESDEWEQSLEITVDPPMKFKLSHIEWL